MNRFYIKSALLSCFLLLLHTAVAHAQQVDFDKIVQPLDAKAREFPEYLVQLAWMNSPESAIVQAEKLNARDASKNTQKEWMRDVQATFNLNEGNLRARDSVSNIFFPRYNFGINLNLYNVLSQKDKNKIGKRQVDIADQKINQRKLEIRSETLSRYAKYKLAKQILKLRALAEQEVYANYILIQQLYKTDEKTFDEYTTASKAYYSAQEDRMKADTDVQLAKLALEEMIGLKWEQVLHPEKED